MEPRSSAPRKKQQGQFSGLKSRISLHSAGSLGLITLSMLLAMSFVHCGPSFSKHSINESENDGTLDSEAGATSSGISFDDIENYEGVPEEPQFTRQSGFERLLKDLNEAFPGSNDLVAPVAKQTEFDPNFCAGLSYGQCLTLIVQVPAATLQISPGLSTLNLAQSAPTYSGLFERACNEGLAVGVAELARRGFDKQRVLGAVQKSRCIFQSLSDELTPLPKLAINEMGFKIRFVEFELQGKKTSTAPAFGTIAFERARIDLKFHDAQVFGSGKWAPLRGAVNLWNIWNYAGVFGTAHAGIPFNQRLNFSFNGQGTADYLRHVLQPILDAARSGEGLGKLGTEIAVIKQAVAAIAAGSNPVVPTLILIGVAADAIRDLCEHQASNCQIKDEKRNVRDEFLDKVGANAVVPSETRATLIDGLKFVPFTVLQGIFKTANVGEMEKSLGLPTRPFWVTR